MDLNEIIKHFDNVVQNGNEYKANCPVCGDTKQHLYITNNGIKTLLHCKKDCLFENIAQSAGLKTSDFFNEPKKDYTSWKTLREHIYTDKDGSPVAKKIILDKGQGEKTAIWERYENGVYEKGLKGLKAPVYHLHKILNSDIIYIAEGEKDVETLEKMGFTATTSPNGAGSKWSNKHNVYFENKEVIVLSDNDGAGKKHGEDVAKSLYTVAKTLKLINSEDIYPALKIKGDISDIVSEVGLDEAKKLLESAVNTTSDYIPAQKCESNEPLECDGDLPPFVYENVNERTGKSKLVVDSARLAMHIREHSNYIFVQDSSSGNVNRFWYSKGCYRLINDEALKGYIKSYITSFSEKILRMGDVREVFFNLTTDLNFIDGDELNNDENIINFQNGLLYLDTMELKPHTPNIYTTIQIPCNWDSRASVAPVFKDFIKTLTGSDTGKQELLLQFMGTCISNVKGFRMKKSLFMVGDGDTGKSQLKTLTERLIGLNNCSGIDLSELEERFGTSNLYNKRLIGSSDMSFVSVKELKAFKKITGGDTLFVEFKGRNAFQYIYNGLAWFCMNRLPKFGGDRGEWVYNRIIVMECNNVIPTEEQDKQLCDKMYNEREAIVYMAIMALKRLISNNYNFTIPESCINQNLQYRNDNNIVNLFYQECCIVRGDKVSDDCTTKRMYDVFKEWCKDNNNGYALSNQDFRRELKDLFHVADIKELERKINGTRYYNFTLTTETKANYRRIYLFDSTKA